MDENKTPVEETVAEAPAAEKAEAPAQERPETATPENEHKHKAREEKRELAVLREKTTELEKALSEEKEKYLRMFAEYDNFRRRSQKERDGIYTDAVSDVVKQLLPIADNLERAGRFSDGEKVAEGLRLTMNALNECLSKLGVTAFGAAGDKFDPNLHNAIMHEEDETRGEGEIVEVFQPGYKRGDKIIRYAMVKVAN
ncbi:MAG: nucleotide exchange factor GrpE [Clostridia bacterium]|nr:nucleotide exchange factor GrpE [Clostridia bacterium]